jgi:DNA primase
VGDYNNRIIVPIMHKMRLVTFTSVDISDDSELRYRHCPDELSIIPIKHYLCGMEQTDGNSIIVVEGLFDWWRFGPGCVPSWGVKLTKEQIFLLSKFNYVKAVGDGDKAGWGMNEHIAGELSAFCQVKVFDLPEGVDPDELTKKEINYIRNR